MLRAINMSLNIQQSIVVSEQSRIVHLAHSLLDIG